MDQDHREEACHRPCSGEGEEQGGREYPHQSCSASVPRTDEHGCCQSDSPAFDLWPSLLHGDERTARSRSLCRGGS